MSDKQFIVRRFKNEKVAKAVCDATAAFYRLSHLNITFALCQDQSGAVAFDATSNVKFDRDIRWEIIGFAAGYDEAITRFAGEFL
jgi:hypothetical protein